MSHTYSSLFLHCVWSTKGRRPLITPDIQQHLYKYIGGIIQNERGDVVAIGGMPDHVHLLMRAPRHIALGDLMRKIKSSSTWFINQNHSNLHYFAWQEGYGVFSVSVSMLETVKNYVLTQEEQHKKGSFAEEFAMLLQKHGIQYDERRLLG